MKKLTFPEACLVANFVTENYPPAREWVDPVGWAAFHLSHGFCSTVHGDNNDILAIGVARPVEEPGDGAVAYRFKEGGECLFIDLMIVPPTMPEAMSVFSKIAEHRFGRPKKVCWFRRGESALRVLDYDKFVNKLRKAEKHYGITINSTAT